VMLLWARRRQRFRGQIFFLWVFGYGVLRFLLEIWRDDPERGSLPPSVPEHVLIPLCLVLFAGAWIVGISRIIESEQLRRASQVISLLPAVVAYFLLKPDTFASAALLQLSTSQAIGLASALAVGAAYLVLDKAALEHPETAMALDLPESDEPEKDQPQKKEADEPAEASSDEPKPAEDESAAEPRPKKKRKKRKKAKKAEPAPDDA
jgi:phosphatidylglycerol---prolipoprotein diacylglyceryl transferase